MRGPVYLTGVIQGSRALVILKLESKGVRRRWGQEIVLVVIVSIVLRSVLKRLIRPIHSTEFGGSLLEELEASIYLDG